MTNQRYSVTGMYLHRGEQREITGSLTILENGQVHGELSDRLSVEPVQKVQGQVQRIPGIVRIILTKTPKDPELLSTSYTLQANGGNGLDGKYSGQWSALPHEEPQGPAMMVPVMDPRVYDIGDYAELMLTATSIQRQRRSRRK